MNVIIDSLWELLQVSGWWTFAGLILGLAMVFSPWTPPKSKVLQVSISVAAGAALPVCNYAAAPIACALLYKGFDTASAMAFFAAASLLNPAGILYSIAYMGGKASAIYLLCCFAAIAGCILTGAFEKKNLSVTCKNKDYASLCLTVCMYSWTGALLQALLTGVLGSTFWKGMVFSPASAGWFSAFCGGMLRHLCIPDDISLAASLIAAGMRPGPGAMLLVTGALTNLTALGVLVSQCDVKTVLKYLAAMGLCAFAAAFVLQLFWGRGFVPHYDLRSGESLVKWGNLLNLPLWSPARIPCALALSAAALAGLAKRCRH